MPAGARSCHRAANEAEPRTGMNFMRASLMSWSSCRVGLIWSGYCPNGSMYHKNPIG